MPEGPEIRLAADRIARVLVGPPLEEAWFAFPALRGYGKRLGGRRVERIDTRGKAMLTRFDNGLTLYTHNQLYGRWYAVRRDRPPRTNRSLRVALHTATHSALLYSASEIEILTGTQLAKHPFLSRLGPDILDAALTPRAVLARLESPSFRRRALGSLYLDQGFLAGIGNYLRSEILFTARVHPGRKPVQLDRSSRQRLARETLKISRRSYQSRGITLPASRARRVRAQGHGYEGYRFWVFGREGLACHRCGGTVQRMAVSGRSLFYCPDCQSPQRGDES